MTGEHVTWDAALADSSQASSAPRALLAHRYEIEGLLGVGGMGSVYRAFDRELDERVALKVLRRELLGDPVTLERFRREVKLARRVTHPNVARVYDIGEHEGVRFLTMELVDGESLAATLAREVALAPARVVAIARAVCDGLSAAHAAGVVHRDLKPDNVILARDGRVVLTDFGIARLAGSGASRTLGMVLGTPQYMAPEQVDPRGEIDGRADLYALGVMLFEMLAGEAPWKGDSPIAIAARRLVAPPPDPGDVVNVPASLAAIVLRLIAREPAGRFASASDVRDALAACRDLDGVGPLPLSLRPTQPPPPLALPPRSPARSIAVMPVRNTGSPEDEHYGRLFGDALCEALIGQPAMTVRSCTVRLADQDARVRGREVGAEVVVTPSLRVTADGGLRVALRVVSVAEGIQLWAGRVDRPLGQLFALARDCAERVAAAMLVPIPARPVAEEGDDPEIIELLSRAHTDATSVEPTANDRAVALLERAITSREEDPRILAAYASALARRVEDGDGILEELVEARSMAERAVSLSPDAVTPHVALARVHLELGESSAAAAQLAFGVDTGHALFQRTLGLLLADAALLEGAAAHLARAARLGERRARWDEAQVRALSGDMATAEAILDEEGPDAAGGYFVVACRLAAWGGNPASLSRLTDVLKARPVRHRDALLAYLGTTPGNVRATHERIEHVARSFGELPRRRAQWFAIAAEAAARAGDRERALSSLAGAVAARLSDVAWLERCPLLDIVRDHPSFAAVLDATRSRTAERALKKLAFEEVSRT